MSHLLAFDSGATATRAGLYHETGELLGEVQGGPSNPAESGVDAALDTMADLARELLGHGGPGGIVAAGVAGAGKPTIRTALARGLCRIAGAARAVVSDDRWPLLVANAGRGRGIVVVSGTGSSVLARSEEGKVLCIGGRGRVLGDAGSAYHVALRALRACSRAFDCTGPDTGLLDRMLQATGCGGMTELDIWCLHAAKNDIASLAKVVIDLAEARDPVAVDCVQKEAHALARQVQAGLDRLALGEDTPVFFHGGFINGAGVFQNAFIEKIHDAKPGLPVGPAGIAGHQAVREMALNFHPSEFISLCEGVAERDASPPPTESRMEGIRPLDRMTAREIVRTMNQADASVAGVVAGQEASIARVVESAARAYARGGRILYVGAGTSGRLGVLDAAECLPTFGIPTDRVVGIIAGGPAALVRSMEGAEDDRAQAVLDLAALERPLNENDLMIGITASGTAPYVLAALEKARSDGAETVLIACNPVCVKGISQVIVLRTGPEVLAGSTRLKAGTATKMVLNMISTGAMALSGHMYEGWMVGLMPMCSKLERRAARIIQTLTGRDAADAAALFKSAKGRIPVAVLMAKRCLDVQAAAALLEETGGSLRAALEDA